MKNTRNVYRFIKWLNCAKQPEEIKKNENRKKKFKTRKNKKKNKEGIECVCVALCGRKVDRKKKRERKATIFLSRSIILSIDWWCARVWCSSTTKKAEKEKEQSSERHCNGIKREAKKKLSRQKMTTEMKREFNQLTAATDLSTMLFKGEFFPQSLQRCPQSAHFEFRSRFPLSSFGQIFSRFWIYFFFLVFCLLKNCRRCRSTYNWR